MTDSGEKGQKAPASSVRFRLLSCGKKFCGHIVSLTVFLLVLLLLLGIYLSFAGFPASVTEHVKVAVAKRGLLLNFERLRLNVRRGLVAEQVEILSEEGGVQIMTSPEVHVNLNWMEGLQRGDWLEGLGIRDGTLYPGALSILPGNLDRPWLAMRHVTTFITIETNAFRMDPFEGRLLGLPLEGKGILLRTLSQAGMDSELSEMEFKKGERKAVQMVLDRIFPVLEGLTWSKDSLMKFDFHISPGNHQEDRMTIEASGKGARVRGQEFDDWRARLALDGRNLTVEELSAGHKQKRARVKGAIDIQKKVLELHAYSALEPACVLALLPWHWAQAVQGEIEIQNGGLEAECWIGPASFHEAASTMTGWAKIQKSTYRDVWIEEGFFSWKGEASDLIFDRLKFLCGTGRAQGGVDGRFRIDTTTKEWDCNLVTTVDPHILIPITPTNLIKLTKRFEFSGENPKISLQLKAGKQPQPHLEFSGNFEARDFSYQGVPGLTTESGIQYSNKTVRLDPFYVERDEGEIYGWLEVDSLKKMTRFDLKSSVHPQALGQIVSTNMGRTVRRLGVEGIGSWTAQGSSDFGAKTNSNFHVQTRMRDARFWRLQSQDLNLSFSSIGTNLQFLIHESELYGGSLTGKIDIAQTQPDRNYQMTVSLAEVGFDQVLDVCRKVEGPPIEGKLHGQAWFSGTLKPFQLPGTEGNGKIQIKEGTLFRLPVLGGLSKLLSKIFPGLGFAVQRDLTASFQLHDEKIYSKDIDISGSAATIQMDGRYHFGHDLDFDVKGQPLGRGLVADVVQLVTLPISKLLEFNLSGTLDNPVWKAKHWPNELSAFIAKDEEEESNE